MTVQLIKLCVLPQSPAGSPQSQRYGQRSKDRGMNNHLMTLGLWVKSTACADKPIRPTKQQNEFCKMLFTKNHITLFYLTSLYCRQDCPTNTDKARYSQERERQQIKHRPGNTRKHARMMGCRSSKE